MEEKKNNVCLLPSQKGIWTIHGIWPTRFGSIGPAFCNKSAVFDVDTLKPFMEQLQQFWLNIEKGNAAQTAVVLSRIPIESLNSVFAGTPTESLWKHEWLKHGTCALVLPELSTENKYFGQGLAWLQQYSMSPLLAKSGVLPDKNFNVLQINQAIKNQLKKNPSIHCIKDRETGDTYLSEIRICFSKQLELVDCDGVVKTFEENALTNCPTDTQINYPSVLPTYLLDRITPETPPFNWRTPLVNFYKLIQLVKWFTL